jgi:uncharacterized protein YdeI (YjbR/CyaY-like superfamily)
VTGEITVVTASSASDWRDWLACNGQAATEAWLVLHHRDGGTWGLRYHEAVEQALCFGWIDGLHRGNGPDSSLLRFTPRTARSKWSRVNRQRAARMTELGQMTEHGQAAIDRAKAAGTWQVLPDQQRLTVPRDLQALLDNDQAARANFARFPPSSRQLILEWIASAKRPATRQRRIQQTVTLAARDIRANHPPHHAATHAADPCAASHRAICTAGHR